MIELLCEKLGKIGLQLNGAKIKLFTPCLDASAASVHINGEEVEILKSDAAHKYLGRIFFR